MQLTVTDLQTLADKLQLMENNGIYGVKEITTTFFIVSLSSNGAEPGDPNYQYVITGFRDRYDNI